jgi:hypothetical protein
MADRHAARTPAMDDVATIARGWKPWPGAKVGPADYGPPYRYVLRNGSIQQWTPGSGAGPSWAHEYGAGDVVAYTAHLQEASNVER